MTTINDVKDYWQDNPLLSFELAYVGSREFFDKLDKIKREDTEKFTLNFWKFDSFRNKRVLDVGCGPGWVSVNYAINGAKVYAIDLTPRAVELTKINLNNNGLTAKVEVGNAEKLQFDNNYFDLIVSSGVLHHTQNIKKAFKECIRVLKPGGKAKITLYRKGILHNKLLFVFVKFVMKLFKIKHPGANLSYAKNVDDFIRQYDGVLNPIGIAMNNKEWLEFINDIGFMVKNSEIHYFPKRFMPLNKIIPNFIHKILDKRFGLMIYFDLIKPMNFK